MDGGVFVQVVGEAQGGGLALAKAQNRAGHTAIDRHRHAFAATVAERRASDDEICHLISAHAQLTPGTRYSLRISRGKTAKSLQQAQCSGGMNETATSPVDLMGVHGWINYLFVVIV